MPKRSDLGNALLDSRKLLIGLVFSMPFLYLLSGLYSVGGEQRGIHYRFGKLINDNVPPGMHYHLPYPIESVVLLPASRIRSMEVDYSQLGTQMQAKELLTGDENLVSMKLLVEYSVAESGAFIHNSQDAEAVLLQLAYAQGALAVARWDIDALLTSGRHRLQQELKLNLQRLLNTLQLGIRISSVQIRQLEPPATVKRAFEQANTAKAEQLKWVQDAKAQRSSRLAESRANIRQYRLQADATANELLKRSEGDSQRLQLQINEYSKAPSTMGPRIYSEMLERVLDKAQLQIFSPSQDHQ
jgi:membrane protease subunit HflK